MKKLFGAVVALVALGSSAFAVDAVWTNAASASAKWLDLANWTDAEGNAIALPPTNGESVVLAPINSKMQTMEWNVPASAFGRYDKYSLSSISELDAFGAVGDAYSHRKFFLNNGYGALWDFPMELTLSDPGNFRGYWYSGHGHIRYVLPATVDKPLAMSNVSAKMRPEINVPTAGTRVTLETVYESGTLEKTGSGELRIGATTGSDTQIHLTSGTLTLDGRPLGAERDEDDVPVPGAWLHLDASRADTIKSYVDETDGRTYVTNWCDVRGNGVYAYFNRGWKPSSSTYIDEIHPPYLSGAVVDGMNVVDFGRTSEAQDASHGPVGCTLDLSEVKTGIWEVFAVSAIKFTYLNTTVLGNYADGGAAYYPFHPSGGSMLVSSSYAKSVAFGECMVDGVVTGNGVFWPQNLGVVSVAPTNSVMLSALANDRSYKGRVGGVRIAELLLFTNRLSHAERMLVHKHLQRKWKFLGGDDCDVGVVKVSNGAANAIGVPEGRIAHAREITVGGGTLVKEGEGVLAVDRLTSASGLGVNVDVRGGLVRFEQDGVAVADDEPAADPLLWLDATIRDSFVFTNKENDVKEYVKRWNDRRADHRDSTYYAEIPTTSGDYVDGAWAWREEGAVDGDKALVDFGTYECKSKNAAFLRLNGVYGTKAVRDGFIVLKTKSTGYSGNVFGSSDISFYRSGFTRFIQPNYGEYPTHAAVWTLDGAFVDPVADGEGNLGASQIHMVSVSSPEALKIDMLAKDRTGQGTAFGGCQIAEQILYGRALSPAERRQTIAYLMKKWMGRNPYEGGTKISKLTLQEGVPAVVYTDRALEVEELAWSGGTLVKRGAGAVATPRDQSELGISSLAVEGGQFAFKGNPLDRIMANTAIHYDATDLSKMDYFVTEDADGSALTNLVKVYDQRLSDNYAVARYNPNAPAPSFTNPTLRVVQTVEGVSRPVFDFGHYNQQMSADIASKDAGSFDLTANSKLREAHVIYADTLNFAGGNAAQMDIFADRGYSLDYFRGSNGALLLNNTSYVDAALAGDMAVDMFRMSGTDATIYKLPRGFHLVSAFPAPCEKNPAGTFTIAAMGNTHDCGVGGCQVGELIAFEQPLSAAESTYLQFALMAKWLGGEAPAWTNAFENLTVAEGATLSIGTDDVIAADVLEGSGTIEAGKVAATGSLALTAGKPLLVGGTFVQTGALSVAVAIDYKPEAGEYAILTADAIEGLDLSTWELSIALSNVRKAKLVRKGNTIYVAIEKKGFWFIIR